MKEEKNIIGKTLKNARLSKKITFEKASKETKIAQSYIKALEEEDFEKIPGEVVLKGFIKIYAEFLGVDSAQLLSELNKKSKKEKTKNEPVNNTQLKKRQENNAIDILKVSKTLLITVSAIILLVGIFSFFGFLSKSIRDSYTIKTSNPENILVLNKNGQIEIEAVIVEKSWLFVKSDGDTIFKGILYEGDKKNWKANKSLWIKIGNAAGVKLYSNNNEILLPKERGLVVVKEFVK